MKKISLKNFRNKRSRTPELNLCSRLLDKYRDELSDEYVRLKEKYQHHFKHPQKHPLYNDTWENFWSKRSDELIRIHCDPHKYDFSGEWKDYFFEKLKKLQDKDYEELKKELARKYSTLQGESRKRNRSDSRSSYKHNSYNKEPTRDASNYRHRSRDSRRSRSTSPAYRRRSHSNKRQSNSRYDNDYRNNRIKIKCEPVVKHEKLKKQKTPSVVSVCQDLLNLDRRLKLHRNVIMDMLDAARDYEKKHQKEYLMTQREYEFLHRTKVFLVQMMGLKWLNKSMEIKMRLVRFQLVVLIRRWEKLMKINGKLETAIKLRKAAEQKTNMYQKCRDQNLRSPGHFSKTNGPCDQKRKSSESATSDYKSMETSSLNNTFNNSGVPDFDFNNVLINIKKEKPDKELAKLMEEKKQLLKQIKQEEIKPEERSPPPQDDAATQENSPKLVIDENHMEMGSIQLSAADISNEELIELYKDFESSSKDELEFVQQIMEELETTDKPRFDYLKGIMEDIQSSYENDFMKFIETVDTGDISIPNANGDDIYDDVSD